MPKDGRWLLIGVGQGWTKAELYLKDLHAPQGAFVPVAAGKEFLYSAEIHDGFLYITTNEDAPRYRVFKAALTGPDRARWKELIPQSEGARGPVLRSARVVAGRLFVALEEAASSRLRVYSLDGKPLGDVPLPGLGTLGAVRGEPDGGPPFYAFESFTTPPTVFEYDAAAGKSAVWEQVKADVDPARLSVSQVWYRSKDGTEVPMFLVSRTGLLRNGKNPTLLHGYGGFEHDDRHRSQVHDRAGRQVHVVEARRDQGRERDLGPA